jgi:prophage maintenance system killer protein
MLAAAFLEVNGTRLTATEEEVYRQTLAFAAGEGDEAQYAEWLAGSSVTAKKKRK